MSQFKLYSDLESHNTIFEIWGGSTKHPDVRFHFNDYTKVDWIDEHKQIFQWLMECASKLTFPVHAYELVEWAMQVAKPF